MHLFRFRSSYASTTKRMILYISMRMIHCVGDIRYTWGLAEVNASPGDKEKGICFLTEA